MLPARTGLAYVNPVMLANGGPGVVYNPVENFPLLREDKRRFLAHM